MNLDASVQIRDGFVGIAGYLNISPIISWWKEWSSLLFKGKAFNLLFGRYCLSFDAAGYLPK